MFLFSLLLVQAHSQASDNFLSDSAIRHASFSLYVADVITGESIFDMNSEKSLTPASIQKLITSAVALELLGPDYTFKTELGYTGKIRRTGTLKGDIIIKGGGDPSFASHYFPGFYNDFPEKWIKEIGNNGIRKIKGKVLTDDSYYDFQPVPSKWIWEDIGNYYGAGVYGASVYDNSYDIHFKTSGNGTKPSVTRIAPPDCGFELTNNLIASGTTDRGYVFEPPYSSGGWISGSIPENREDFVLSASIPDPPLLIATMIYNRLKSAEIKVTGDPSTTRLEKQSTVNTFTVVSEYVSPPLSEITEVLNHESVNLYAEHLLKEMGKKFRGQGTTSAGIDIVVQYLDSIGIDTDGAFIADGSGLSPANSINARIIVSLLMYMKQHGKYFDQYYNSLPEAGKEGTLKNFFRDNVFNGNLRAKSGSMTRVRSYAGYFTTKSGREMVFAFITNDFPGPQKNIVSHYEKILKEIILEY